MLDIRNFLAEECHGFALDDETDRENLYRAIDRFLKQGTEGYKKLKVDNYIPPEDIEPAKVVMDLLFQLATELSLPELRAWAEQQYAHLEGINRANKAGPMG